MNGKDWNSNCFSNYHKALRRHEKYFSRRPSKTNRIENENQKRKKSEIHQLFEVIKKNIGTG